MKTFKPYLMAALGCAVILAVIALMNVTDVSGQNKKAPEQVQVVNQSLGGPNVPIAGRVAVSNFPATQQVSGSVGILGTPGVNVANMPTVGIDTLNNTVKLLRDPENPARQPFKRQVQCSFNGNDNCGDTSITVPAGKELVVEFVSGLVFMENGVRAELVRATGSAALPPSGAVFFFGPTLQFEDATRAVSVGSFPTRIYIDPGNFLVLGCSLSKNSVNGICSVSISGYLVNVP